MALNKFSDPLADPEIALRIAIQRQRLAAFAMIVFGVICFVAGVLPLMGRAQPMERFNQLWTVVACLGSFVSTGLVAISIKILVRENPLIKLVLDLNDRVRCIEGKLDLRVPS